MVPGSLWPTPDVTTAQDHYWLGRPTAAGTTQWANAFYPYGSTGQGSYLLHHGADIANPLGTPLLAPATGTVVFAQPYLSYGPSVILSHGGGYYTVYLYLSEILVREGELVATGQVLGRVGGADTPEGPHLEFQIRVNREAVDPRPWLRRSGG